MTEHFDQERELNDVLDAFVGAGVASLTAWRTRYPQFDRELVEFAAAWRLSESLPISHDAAQVSDQTIAQIGLRAIRARAPIQSLVNEARALDMRPREFAARSELGQNVLLKLDRGLIRFASIPRAAIDRLAAVLQRDVEAIQSYLQTRHPTVAPMAAFKSEQAPAVGDLEDFAAAVQSDPTLTPEQRQHWTDLAPPSA